MFGILMENIYYKNHFIKTITLKDITVKIAKVKGLWDKSDISSLLPMASKSFLVLPSLTISLDFNISSRMTPQYEEGAKFLVFCDKLCLNFSP